MDILKTCKIFLVSYDFFMYKSISICYNMTMDINEEYIERQLRSAERTFLKLRRLKKSINMEKARKDLPTYLHGNKRHWSKVVASGIIQGILIRCCNTGCVDCNWIGWKRGKSGNIININPSLMTTGECAAERGVGYKTISRLCDDGKILSFKLPGSNTRYIINE